MERLIFTPEENANGAKSLEMCDGWKGWFVPIQERRLEEIREQLLNEGLSERETERLRMEYRIVKELLNRPAAMLASLRKAPERPGPSNGAV